MENKEEWKEIEKWNEQKEFEREEKYGVDITKLSGSEGKIDKFSKTIEIIVKVLHFIGKAAVILAIIIAYISVFSYFSNVHQTLGK